MIPDPNCVPQIVQDYQIVSNLALILRLLTHVPVAEYEARVARYKARVVPSGFSRLEQRVVNLEKRQILTEAELTLLKGQLEYEGVKRW